jgi:hypothetical protein
VSPTLMSLRMMVAVEPGLTIVGAPSSNDTISSGASGAAVGSSSPSWRPSEKRGAPGTRWKACVHDNEIGCRGCMCGGGGADTTRREER